MCVSSLLLLFIFRHLLYHHLFSPYVVLSLLNLFLLNLFLVRLFISAVVSLHSHIRFCTHRHVAPFNQIIFRGVCGSGTRLCYSIAFFFFCFVLDRFFFFIFLDFIRSFIVDIVAVDFFLFYFSSRFYFFAAYSSILFLYSSVMVRYVTLNRISKQTTLPRMFCLHISVPGTKSHGWILMSFLYWPFTIAYDMNFNGNMRSEPKYIPFTYIPYKTFGTHLLL